MILDTQEMLKSLQTLATQVSFASQLKLTGRIIKRNAKCNLSKYLLVLIDLEKLFGDVIEK